VQLKIGRRHGGRTPVMPPMTKVTMNPIDHRIGTVKRTRPPYIVNSQFEDFDARRHRDDHGHHAEEAVDIRAGAHGEEMVQPDQEGENAIAMVAATIER